MTQKYIKDDLVMTRTEPNNFTPNGVVCKFVDYETIDKVLLRTDFVRLRNMLAIFKRRYAKNNYEADSIQEVIEAVDRRLGY